MINRKVTVVFWGRETVTNEEMYKVTEKRTEVRTVTNEEMYKVTDDQLDSTTWGCIFTSYVFDIDVKICMR